MRKIFFIYWIWYVASLIILISGISMELFYARIFGLSMFINYSFIAIAPIFSLIYQNKSHRSDQRFLNACVYSLIIRTVIWCFSYYGINDYKAVLCLNAFGMFVFILIERKLKQISGEYFNYQYIYEKISSIEKTFTFWAWLLQRIH